MSNILGILDKKLFQFQKFENLKIIKFKNLDKSKNYTNLSKS